MPKHNPLVPCACGCGTLRPKYDQEGRPREYVVGHHRRKPNAITRLPNEPNPLVECACGCGVTFRKYPPDGRAPRRYLHGHQNQTKECYE